MDEDVPGRDAAPPPLLSDVLKRVKMWGRGAEAAFRGTEGELRCFEPYLNGPEAGLRLY